RPPGGSMLRRRMVEGARRSDPTNRALVAYVGSMDQALAFEGSDTVTSDHGARAEAIGRLFDRHHARLYRLALRLTWGDDEARDLVQECFLRAIEHRIPDDPV